MSISSTSHVHATQHTCDMGVHVCAAQSKERTTDPTHKTPLMAHAHTWWCLGEVPKWACQCVPRRSHMGERWMWMP